MAFIFRQLWHGSKPCGKTVPSQKRSTWSTNAFSIPHRSSGCGTSTNRIFAVCSTHGSVYSIAADDYPALITAMIALVGNHGWFARSPANRRPPGTPMW